MDISIITIIIFFIVFSGGSFAYKEWRKERLYINLGKAQKKYEDGDYLEALKYIEKTFDIGYLPDIVETMFITKTQILIKLNRNEEALGSYKSFFDMGHKSDIIYRQFIELSKRKHI